jgi:O-methyltransferase
VTALPDIAVRVRERHLTYLSEAKLRSLFAVIARLKAERVPGDFLEFGVALGGSAICIASELDGGRRFFGFDVFGMIPAPSLRDGAKPNARYEVIKGGQSNGIGGETYYGYMPELLETVKTNLAAFGLAIDGGRINLVKGPYSETLSTPAQYRIALAHIDCDWYDSVWACLRYVQDALVPGGAVIADDYNDWEGAKTAVDEFCASRPDVALVRTSPHGVIIRR